MNADMTSAIEKKQPVSAARRLEQVKHFYNPVLVNSEPEAGKILSAAEGGCLLPPHPRVLERIRKENFNDILNPYQTYSKHFLEELMYEIVDYFKDDLKIDLAEDGSSKNWIVIGNGSAQIFDSFLFAAFNDKNGFAKNTQKAVLAPTPYYHSYAAYPPNYNAYYEPIFVENEKDYKLSGDALDRKMTELRARGEDSKILVLTNPTIPGSIYSYEEMQDLAEAITRHDLYVFCDEVFKDTHFNPQTRTISLAQIPGMDRRVITATSGSKARSAAGLRIGWAAGPRRLIRTMTDRINTSIIQLPLITQYAATEVLKTPQTFLQTANTELQKRADYIRVGIGQINDDLERSGLPEKIAMPVRPVSGHYMALNFDEFSSNPSFPQNGAALVQSLFQHSAKNGPYPVLLSSGYSRGEDALTLYLAFSQTGYAAVNQFCYAQSDYHQDKMDPFVDSAFKQNLNDVLDAQRKLLDLPMNALSSWVKSHYGF